MKNVDCLAKLRFQGLSNGRCKEAGPRIGGTKLSRPNNKRDAINGTQGGKLYDGPGARAKQQASTMAKSAIPYFEF